VIDDPESRDPSGPTIGDTILYVDRNILLEEGNYRYWEFEFDGLVSTFQANFTVRTGSDVELILMNESEFRRYQQGQSYRQKQQSTDIARESYQTEGEIIAGEYVVVLDNTCNISCDKQESASVDLTIEVFK
jgi:hypothetical protein